jgi:hypothetical protein
MRAAVSLLLRDFERVAEYAVLGCVVCADVDDFFVELRFET